MPRDDSRPGTTSHTSYLSPPSPTSLRSLMLSWDVYPPPPGFTRLIAPSFSTSYLQTAWHRFPRTSMTSYNPPDTLSATPTTAVIISWSQCGVKWRWIIMSYSILRETLWYRISWKPTWKILRSAMKVRFRIPRPIPCPMRISQSIWGINRELFYPKIPFPVFIPGLIHPYLHKKNLILCFL